MSPQLAIPPELAGHPAARRPERLATGPLVPWAEAMFPQVQAQSSAVSR